MFDFFSIKEKYSYYLINEKIKEINIEEFTQNKMNICIKLQTFNIPI